MFVALEDCPSDVFTAKEKALLDSVMSYVCDHHSANSISELSHDSVWDAANEGEEIPMCATLVSASAEMTPEVAKWARGIVKKLSGERHAA